MLYFYVFFFENFKNIRHYKIFLNLRDLQKKFLEKWKCFPKIEMFVKNGTVCQQSNKNDEITRFEISEIS